MKKRRKDQDKHRAPTPTPRPPRVEPMVIREEDAGWLDRLDPERRRYQEKVVIGLRYITREEANEWLLRVKENYQRHLGLSVVARYRFDMDAGDFVDGVPVIAFDAHGNLINGQHILSAHAGSNLETIQVIWVINSHPKAYVAYDNNKKRSIGDALKWGGHEDPAKLGAAAQVGWQEEQALFEGRKFHSARSAFLSPAHVKEFVDGHLGLTRHIIKHPFKGKGFAQGALYWASYRLQIIDPDLHAQFFATLIEDWPIPTRQYPPHVLHAAFKGMGEGDRWRNGDTLLMFYKAWNAFIRGEDLSSRGLTPKKGESFVYPINPRDLQPNTPNGPRGRVM